MYLLCAALLFHWPIDAADKLYCVVAARCRWVWSLFSAVPLVSEKNGPGRTVATCDKILDYNTFILQGFIRSLYINKWINKCMPSSELLPGSDWSYKLLWDHPLSHLVAVKVHWLFTQRHSVSVIPDAWSSYTVWNRRIMLKQKGRCLNRSIQFHIKRHLLNRFLGWVYIRVIRQAATST